MRERERERGRERGNQWVCEIYRRTSWNIEKREREIARDGESETEREDVRGVWGIEKDFKKYRKREKLRTVERVNMEEKM